MYRPTIRMDDVFRDWINEVDRVTSLDKNQIVRLALFLLGHSQKGKFILENYLKPSEPLPSPKWDTVEHGFWMNQTFSAGVGETSPENDVSDYVPRDYEIIEGGISDAGKVRVHANEEGCIKWNISG